MQKLSNMSLSEARFDLKMIETHDEIKWHEWQQKIIDLIAIEPDNRTINWFWGEKRNNGRRFLKKYLNRKYNVVTSDGSRASVYKQYNNNLKKEDKRPLILLIDICKIDKKYVNYVVMENIKDGSIHSRKGALHLRPHHLLVFANFPPDETKLSIDRLNVVRMDIQQLNNQEQ